MPLPADRAGWTPDPLNAECPSRQVLDLVADKWAVLVIAAIAEGHRRNGQLLRRVDGISQKALTRSLRDLAYNGLVDRHDFAEVPPHVEYALTPTGESLRPLLAALCAWAVEHIDDVASARSAHAG
jgi:DNA-binding HxlR family transcriptional regulator